MTEHDAAHEEELLAHALGEPDARIAERPALVARMVECEACMTYAARLAEETVALGGDPARVLALIDEALVWLAVRADTGGPPPHDAPEPAGVGRKRR